MNDLTRAEYEAMRDAIAMRVADSGGGIPIPPELLP